jgi:hypothetical protein
MLQENSGRISAVPGKIARKSVVVYTECYEIGRFRNGTMTLHYDQYRINRTGKRLAVPREAVSDIYQRHRKRRVKVEICTAPKKLDTK